VKGELGRDGGLLLDCAREVLIGDRQGRVTPAAGQVPLIRSFYADCKRHRIDVSGAARTVRCDVHKQERHRLKSAFLHQCAYLDIPIFGRLPERYWRSERLHYSGPDLATGTDMHLIAESWAVQWSEAVDDRLVELCDRGPTLARAAESTLWSAIQAGTTDASLASKLLLRSAQMGLVDLFDDALEVVDQALIADTHFEHLVISLGDFVVLHQYRDAVPTRGHQRVARTIAVAFQRACLRLPAIRHTPDSASRDSLDRLQELVRITLSCEAVDLDRVLLVEKLRELVVDAEGQPMIRGAGLGILYSLGAVREGVLVRELDGYLRGSPTRVGQTGAFLEGVFATAKSLVMGSPRLLRAMDQVLRRMEWETFKRILPDLRRAFTQFIPTEIDQISRRVAEEIGLDRVSRSDAPAPEALVRLAAGADRRAAEVLGTWLRDEPIASEETRAEEIGHR